MGEGEIGRKESSQHVWGTPIRWKNGRLKQICKDPWIFCFRQCCGQWGKLSYLTLQSRWNLELCCKRGKHLCELRKGCVSPISEGWPEFTEQRWLMVFLIWNLLSSSRLKPACFQYCDQLSLLRVHCLECLKRAHDSSWLLLSSCQVCSESITPEAGQGHGA